MRSRSPSKATFTLALRHPAGATLSSAQARLCTAGSPSSWPVAARHTVRAMAQRLWGLSNTTASIPPCATDSACAKPTCSSCKGLLPTNSVVTSCSCSCISVPLRVRTTTRQRLRAEGRSMLHTAAAMATARERPSLRVACSRSASNRGYSPTLALTKNTRSFTKPTCTGRNSPARRASSSCSTAASASSAKPCSRLK